MLVKMISERCVLFLFLIQIVRSDDSLVVITKLPRIPLTKYYSYSSVMILHFNIPSDINEAVFKFKARDDSTSMLVRSCDPRNVSVYMKSGSYPVINPDGVALPHSFLNISRPEIYELTLQTDRKPNFLNITSPEPGNWFGVAFISWTDPKKDRIEQQGLTSQCEASIQSELSVKPNLNIHIISSDSESKTILLEHNPKFYKFFIPDNTDHILLSIDILTPCKLCENLMIFSKNNAIPHERKHDKKLEINAKKDGINLFRIRSPCKSWHYLKIEIENNKNVRFKEYVELSVKFKTISALLLLNNQNRTTIDLFKSSVSKKLSIENQVYNIPAKQYDLMRLTAPDNFIFEYDFPAVANGTNPVLLNVTNKEISILTFEVFNIIDIGGTLTLGLAIKPDVIKTRQMKNKNYTVIACVRNSIHEIPIYPSQCLFNNNTSKASMILNSSSAGTLEFLHIPYPDPGTYFLSLRAFFNDCTPCNCSTKCQSEFDTCVRQCEYNCTDDCEQCSEFCDGSADCHDCAKCDGDCEVVDDDDVKNTSLVFSISSHPCIAGRCGKQGKCNHYMAGGYIFSSCQCFGGYRGWDCSDGSESYSDNDILLSILLLTLSNLLFIPSVYFAYKRSYYTEAVTYFASMVSSTFYHACDSKENQYGFCLFPLGVLQFLDFYCALLGIWVTLVAMAYTSNRIISICHVLGAIVLAFGVTYNKHALWVYLLPTISGVIIIGINWGLQCRRTRKLFPAKIYLILYMPLGAFLVLLGLISFAFLETKENYKVVHSLWHMIMAVSLIFLLPIKTTFTPKC